MMAIHPIISAYMFTLGEMHPTCLSVYLKSKRGEKPPNLATLCTCLESKRN